MRSPDVMKTDVPEQLDAGSAALLRNGIRQHLAHGTLAHWLDLRALEHLDSHTLAGLIQTLRAVREFGGSVSLLVDQPRMLRVFALTGLNRIFRIYATEAEAANGRLRDGTPVNSALRP